jgi:hypothetical protein
MRTSVRADTFCLTVDKFLHFNKGSVTLLYLHEMIAGYKLSILYFRIISTRTRHTPAGQTLDLPKFKAYRP